MCEERIHKEILKKCVMPVCEEKNDSMENGILEKKTIPRIFIFSDGATRIVTKRTGEDRKRDEASWGRKGYCSAV